MCERRTSRSCGKKGLVMSTPTPEPIPHYETAQQLVPSTEPTVLDEAAVENIPTGVDLYVVFMDPATV